MCLKSSTGSIQDHVAPHMHAQEALAHKSVECGHSENTFHLFIRTYAPSASQRVLFAHITSPGSTTLRNDSVRTLLQYMRFCWGNLCFWIPSAHPFVARAAKVAFLNGRCLNSFGGLPLRAALPCAALPCGFLPPARRPISVTLS